jgi:hypothetical protein
MKLKLKTFTLKLSRPIVFGPTAASIRYDEVDELAQPWIGAIVGWGATAVRNLHFLGPK